MVDAYVKFYFMLKSILNSGFVISSMRGIQ